MQRLFVFLILTFSVVGDATADAREPLPILRQLCIADHGTGFNWKDAAWMQVNYMQPKFVALKVDYPEIYPKDGPGDEIQRYFYCTIAFGEETDVNLETFKSYNACLRVQEVGVEHSTYFACSEFHTQDKESGNWSVNFNCSENGFDTFHMRPNGHFHKGHIHGNVQDKPEDDYKDSLVIFVGKCVGIAN